MYMQLLVYQVLLVSDTYYHLKLFEDTDNKYFDQKHDTL